MEIEFNFNQAITNIQAKLDDPFQDVINKFMQKSLLDPGSVNFLANGKVINPNQSVENHMSNLNKENKKMKIIVSMTINDEENKKQVIVKSKDIICPTCKEPCRIITENSKIKLYECINGHNVEDIKFIDFDKTQNINESQIKCDNCKFKNKGNCPADEFYRCLNCKLNLCLLCKPNHDPRHNIIKYDQRNYIYFKIKLFECINGHIIEDIKFIDFDNTQKINESEIICNNCKFKNKGNCPADEFYRCLNCKLNLCLLCKPNHDPRHNIIKYDNMNYI